MRPLADETMRRIDGAREGAPTAAAALLTALNAVQAERGHVGSEEISCLADLLGLSRAHVQGVARFYDRITELPTGRHVVAVCEGISCYLRGGEALAAAFAGALGVAVGERTPDGRFTLRRAACIGACDRAPALLLDDETLGPVAPQAVASLLASAPARKEGDDADPHR